MVEDALGVSYYRRKCTQRLEFKFRTRSFAFQFALGKSLNLSHLSINSSTDWALEAFL